MTKKSPRKTEATATSRNNETQSQAAKYTLNEEQKNVMANIINPGSVTVIIGEPGTGKSFLTAWAGFKLLKDKTVKRLIVTRPTVEAGGRSMGFLPGDVDQKFDQYLLAYADFCAKLGNSGHATFPDMVHKGQIVKQPLQFMRSLTYNTGDFVIADEMQNCNEDEMLLLLTRMGDGGRLVITGDLLQKDTRRSERSGLEKLLEIAPKLDFVNVFELQTNERSPRIKRLTKVWTGEEE